MQFTIRELLWLTILGPPELGGADNFGSCGAARFNSRGREPMVGGYTTRTEATGWRYRGMEMCRHSVA